MHRRLLPGLALAAALGCAHPSQPAIKPNIDPGLHPMPDTSQSVTTPLEPAIPPEEAFLEGAMPLASTGIPAFLHDHPDYDGRGVLIGILDSGIDPGVPGLGLTTTGERKILDLRDFSREGAVALQPVSPSEDTVRIGRRVLAGFSRVVSFDAHGPFYGGLVAELPLGEGPAADLNGNGTVGDTLPVVVARASDGWVLFADTDGDGTLADERPIHDYLVAHEIFGWHRPGGQPTLTMAVNFREEGDRPGLDLFFDTSGHGTHVSGIAAGHDMYKVPGFNGVAPGAWLLGLKIANDAQGGVSTTGSMLRAMDYAIRFAAARQLPLVLNMSFGVGNEIEGTARIDQLVDSVLAAHPDLVFTISAGNDGPGLSTLGFPGSAQLPITVGAMLPVARRPGMAAPPEPVAYFSSRGGELAKPDLVTPGTAYSTVPPWHAGEEEESGTSMASPHAAGLAALLRSGLRQEQRTASAREIKQALMATAHPVEGESYLDAGSGIPDIGAAWAWLAAGHRLRAIEVSVPDGHGVSAAYRPAGLAGVADTLQRFVLTPGDGAGRAVYHLRSDAPWLLAPDSVVLGQGADTVALRYHLAGPSVLTRIGVVTGWGADTAAGPAFRLVNAIGASVPADSSWTESAFAPIAAGGQRRLFILADSGQPFEVRTRVGSMQRALVFLHEPDGMPLRGSAPQIAVPGDQEVGFRPDARDIVSGAYQVAAVAPPTQKSSVLFHVLRPPVTFDAARTGDGVAATVTDRGRSQAAGTVSLALTGAERTVRVISRGSDTTAIPVVIPGWAEQAQVDVVMDPRQWSRFTDFGVTLFHQNGEIIESLPLNYALGRLSVDSLGALAGAPAVLRLFPALAEPESTERWTATVYLRFYAADSIPLQAAGGGSFTLAGGSSAMVRFAWTAPSWELGDGFYPLGSLTVQTAGEPWTRQVPLAPPVPALRK